MKIAQLWRICAFGHETEMNWTIYTQHPYIYSLYTIKHILHTITHISHASLITVYIYHIIVFLWYLPPFLVPQFLFVTKDVQYGCQTCAIKRFVCSGLWTIVYHFVLLAWPMSSWIYIYCCWVLNSRQSIFWPFNFVSFVDLQHLITMLVSLKLFFN
jgi:hypothetical protein